MTLDPCNFCRKLFLSLFTIVLITNSVLAQDRDSYWTKKNVYSQVNLALGTVSVLYENYISKKASLNSNIYFGLSKTLDINFSGDVTYWGLPLGINFILGNNNSHFEAALGVTFWREHNKNRNVFSTANHQIVAKLGYRFQDYSKNGFNFRAGLSPFYFTSRNNDYRVNEISVDLYISCGYNF